MAVDCSVVCRFIAWSCERLIDVVTLIMRGRLLTSRGTIDVVSTSPSLQTDRRLHARPPSPPPSRAKPRMARLDRAAIAWNCCSALRRPLFREHGASCSSCDSSEEIFDELGKRFGGENGD